MRISKKLLPWLLLLMIGIVGCDKNKDEDNGSDDSLPGIYGQIVDADGQPLEGVEVHLITVQGIEIDGVEVTVPDSLCNLRGE